METEINNKCKYYQEDKTCFFYEPLIGKDKRFNYEKDGSCNTIKTHFKCSCYEKME